MTAWTAHARSFSPGPAKPEDTTNYPPATPLSRVAEIPERPGKSHHVFRIRVRQPTEVRDDSAWRTGERTAELRTFEGRGFDDVPACAFFFSRPPCTSARGAPKFGVTRAAWTSVPGFHRIVERQISRTVCPGPIWFPRPHVPGWRETVLEETPRRQPAMALKSAGVTTFSQPSP